MLLIFFAIVITITLFLYYHFTKYNNYWKDRNVPGPEPTFFFGNIKDAALRKTAALEIYAEICDRYPDEKVIGIFRMRTPELLVTDLDIINNILIKNFDLFMDRGLAFGENELGCNIFHTTADKWRVLRGRFTPLFTSGKLRNMTYLMTDLGDKFVNYVDKVTQIQPEVEAHIFTKKFTQSVVAACAFGIDIDYFDDELSKTLQRVDHHIVNNGFTYELEMMYPCILTRTGISLFPKEVKQFFTGFTKKVIAQRNGEPTNRNDFIDLLLALRKAKKITGKRKSNDDTEQTIYVTDELITAQSFIFFFAGNETAAMSAAAMLHALALHPDIQDKLLAEIQQVLQEHEGKLTYDAITEMTYMDKVFHETLRLYMVAETVRRCPAVDYKLPGTDIVVKKGQIIMMPMNVIHKNPKYYPNPEVFDPERFTPENIAARHSCAYIPFGLGPRQCIGVRFARLQTKVCVAKLLLKYRVEPSRNTKREFKYMPARLVQKPIGGYPLNFFRRQ